MTPICYRIKIKLSIPDVKELENLKYICAYVFIYIIHTYTILYIDR